MRKYILLSFILLVFCADADAESSAKQTYMVSMRDGVKLATDVYRPAGFLPQPVLLYRTRYNKNSTPLTGIITPLNYKGYVCVVQDTRGRYASQGVDSLFISDGWGALQDGYDTIEWLSQQSWCNGNIGMLGVSADGIVTYRAAATLHPALKCAVAVVAATDFYHQVVYPGGEYRKALCENYLTGQNASYLIDYYLQNPYYNDIWQAMNWHTRSDSIRIPMLHIGGWYDCFAEGPPAAFRDLRQKPHAAPQQLIMGPWTHGLVGSDYAVGEMRYPSAGYDVYGHIIRWFDYWLLGRDTGIGDDPAVRYYLMGDPDKIGEAGCAWMEAETWPPADSENLILYLSANNALHYHPGADGCESFTYDPDHPLPTRGGNNLTIAAGPFDQSDMLTRDDVLTFASEILQQPLRVEGQVQGHFFVSSDAPDTDITLKLVDVFPDGRRMLVTDGIRRLRFRNGFTAAAESFLRAGEVVPVTVTLPPTAIVFNSGHRLMVAVSSSNYNRFATNPNNAAAVNDRSERRKAVNTVHYGATYASAVTLPVTQSATAVALSSETPADFNVSAAYPNPFNRSVRINYSLPRPGSTTIQVRNIRGQVVRTMIRSQQSAGEHQAVWDGADDTGRVQPSGLYYLWVQSGDRQRRVKICLLR